RLRFSALRHLRDQTDEARRQRRLHLREVLIAFRSREAERVVRGRTRIRRLVGRALRQRERQRVRTAGRREQADGGLRRPFGGREWDERAGRDRRAAAERRGDRG